MESIAQFTPLRNSVFVEELDNGARLTRGGLILLDDNMKDHGIKPRWARIYALGPEVDDLRVGDWVLIKHGRWTNAISVERDGQTLRVWRVEYPEAVVMAADSDPREHILLDQAAHSHAHHPHYLGPKIATQGGTK